MKTMIALLLFVAPGAFAYGYYENTYQVGNSQYTYGQDYNTGTTYNYNTYKMGNSVYGSGYDSKGNSVHCTSYRIGNSVQTNCY